MPYRLILPIEPVPAARPKLKKRGRGAYYPARYADFRAKAKRVAPAACMVAGIGGPLVGPLVVGVRVICTRPKQPANPWPKPDVDNYAKAILDSLNGLAWEDDCQVLGLAITKEWALPGEVGRSVVSIEKLDEQGIQAGWARTLPGVSK